jgi:hypothetical protein
MEELEKDFVPYPLALRLKALGFDNVRCLAVWYSVPEMSREDYEFFNFEPHFRYDHYETQYYANKGYKNAVLAPTFSQAFRWLRKTYPNVIFEVRQSSWKEVYSEFFDFKIHIEHKNKTIKAGGFVSYERAELSCLVDLLEIVENENK